MIKLVLEARCFLSSDYSFGITDTMGIFDIPILSYLSNLLRISLMIPVGYMYLPILRRKRFMTTFNKL